MTFLHQARYTWMALLLAAMALLPFPLASAETLADIDAEIQSDKTIEIHRAGYDAYNIYKGVTDSRLDRKIELIKAAGGVSERFYYDSDDKEKRKIDYRNFYSFTSIIGVTDTKLDIIKTTATQRLYRRGDSDYKEAKGYLGSWWGDQYLGVQDSRNKQAILAAWGSDLQRIYVIDVPAGYTLVGGFASPMEKNGEYRLGGIYQYYYRGASTSWVVYALYAPDYLKSYSGAVTSAQQAGRSITANLGAHLNQIRYEGTLHLPDQSSREGHWWVRGFSGNVDGNESDGSFANSQTTGMSVGWQQQMTRNSKDSDQSKSYIGLVLGQAKDHRSYGVYEKGNGNVENRTKATIGGIYGLYVHRPNHSRSSYEGWSFQYGGVSFSNTVPGELGGAGLKQDYRGNITMITVENGISFRQTSDWVLEPQLQFSYTKVSHSDFSDHLGARVSLKQGYSFWGRIGLEARRTIVHTPERTSRYWARASYIYEFAGANEVDVAGDRGISKLKKNRYVLAIGADLQMNRTANLQGEIAKVFGGEKGLQGNLALKYRW